MSKTLTHENFAQMLEDAKECLDAFQRLAEECLAIAARTGDDATRAALYKACDSATLRPNVDAIVRLATARRYYDENILRLRANSARVKASRDRKAAGITRATRSDGVPVVPAGTDLDEWHRSQGHITVARPVPTTSREDVRDELDF